MSMTIEYMNKKDGTRIRHKDFPYLEEGKVVGAAYDKIIFGCKKEHANAEETDMLCKKLEAWHKTKHTEKKAGTVILLIFISFIVPFILIPVLFAFSIFIKTYNYKTSISLLLIAVIPCLIICFMVKLIKRQKNGITKTDRIYQEATGMVSYNPPEIFSCRIIDKQWFEAIDEVDCYFLKSDYFTVRVSLSKYNQAKTGDELRLALMHTNNDHLLFLL